MRLLDTHRRLAGSFHGFSTRRGGVSTGRYESLNLGASWGDEPAAVAEHRRLLAAEGGFGLGRHTYARQVHSNACVNVDGRHPAAVRPVEADALVTTEAGRAVGVFTADCLPILFADEEGRVAAAHAGWRGTVSGIAGATV